jgi:beta-lactamase regulating signal transducer with metallopeptidase domain/C-terminal processing protease CtpA/Prc
MNELWTSAGGWMLRTIVGGGLLLLAAYLMMRWTRQPARRQRLGDWGMAGALLVALCSGIGPSWLVIAWTRGETADVPGQPLGQPHIVETAHVALLEEDESAMTPQWHRQLADAHVESESSLPGAPQSWAEKAGVAAILFAAGVGGFFAIRLLLGYVALVRLLWRSESASPEIRGLFDTMAAGTRWVRLLVSRRLLVPLSCGLVRPAVVLPSGMCQPPEPRQLRWIFAHELTHLRRHDAWSGLLFSVGQVFFFALPWFWWVRRQVRLCQEYVADAAAAQQDDANVEYAEFLVSLANAPAVPVGASAVSGHGSDLFRRVTMLLNDPVKVETRCPRLWTMLVAGGLASLAVLVSGFSYRAEAAGDDQIIIIIRPQGEGGKGDAEKKEKVIIHRVETDQAKGKEVRQLRVLEGVTAKPPKINEAGQIQLWDASIKLAIDGWQEAGQIRLWDASTGKPIKIDTAELQSVTKKEGEQKIVVQFDANGQKTVVLAQGDELERLRSILKELERLKKDGKLTNERIESELLKAVEKINARRSRDTAPEKDSKDMKQVDKLYLNRQPEPYYLYVQPHNYEKDAKLYVQPSYYEVSKGLNSIDPRFRLGVAVETISPAIAEHLKLPNEVGLLVTHVLDGSPAAKAGIKVNDVLVKIGSEMVPAKSVGFGNWVSKLKANTPLEVVVLRKGETLNVGNANLERLTKEDSLKTQEAARVRRVEANKERQKILALKDRDKATATTTVVARKGDTLTITHKEAGATLIVTGVLKDGKAQIGTIEVNDGKETRKYSNVQAVPEPYRAQVEKLVEAVSRLENLTDDPPAESTDRLFDISNLIRDP